MRGDCSLLWQRAYRNRGDDAAASIRRRSKAANKRRNIHFQTVICPLPHPIERAGFEAALQGLPPEVWRVKGFVHLRGEGLHLLQYTGGGAQSRYQSRRIIFRRVLKNRKRRWFSLVPRLIETPLCKAFAVRC
jgi:hypothetical protein